MQRHLAVGAVLWGILLGTASGQLERYAVAGRFDTHTWMHSML